MPSSYSKNLITFYCLCFINDHIEGAVAVGSSKSVDVQNKIEKSRKLVSFVLTVSCRGFNGFERALFQNRGLHYRA